MTPADRLQILRAANAERQAERVVAEIETREQQLADDPISDASVFAECDRILAERDAENAYRSPLVRSPGQAALTYRTRDNARVNGSAADAAVPIDAAYLDEFVAEVLFMQRRDFDRKIAGLRRRIAKLERSAKKGAKDVGA
jgi:hypothetical protein